MEPWRGRRNDYESYRPNYDNGAHQGRRDRSTNRRPSLPSRSNSRWDKTSNDFGSPKETLTESPRSPQMTYSESNVTLGGNSSAIPRDPRRARSMTKEASDIVSSHRSPTETTMADYFRELAKQALIDERLQQAEEKVRSMKQRESDVKDKFPDNNSLLGMLARNRKADEENLHSCSQAAHNCGQRINTIIANLPSMAKDLLRGVVSAPIPESRQNQPENLLSDIKMLTEKVDLLTKQTKAQHEVIQRLSDSNAEGDALKLVRNLESKMTSSSDTSKNATNERFAALDKRLQAYEAAIALHKEAIETHRSDLQKQRSGIDAISIKQKSVTDSLSLVQQNLANLEPRESEVATETPNLLSKHDLKVDVSDMKAQLKEQERQIASLSGTFVSKKEHADSIAQMVALKTMLDRVEQEVIQTRQTLESSESSTRMTNESPDIGQQEELSKLQGEINKLTRFSGHYQNFYDKTQEDLKELNNKTKVNYSKLTEIQGDVTREVSCVSEICQKNKKAIDELSTRATTIEERCLNSIADLITQLETWKAGTRESIEANFAQTATAVADTKSLKKSIDQTSHSIQSLDARYSAISTQKLYHSIVATIQPLLPGMREVPGHLRSVREAMVNWDQTATQLRGQVEGFKADNIVLKHRVQMLESALNESSVDAQSLQAAQPETTSHDDATITQHTNNDTTELERNEPDPDNQNQNRVSKIKDLYTKLTALEAIIQDQQQTMVNKIPLLDDLVRLKGVFEQRKEGIDLLPEADVVDKLKELQAFVDRVQDGLKALETGHDNQSKMIDSLRNDITILEDLRARVQAVQTDMKAHEQIFFTVDTSVQRIQRLEQMSTRNLADAEKEVKEQESVGGLRNDLIKVAEGVKDATLKHAQLRARLDKLETVAFPQQDRYVVCRNVASVIDETKLSDGFIDCTLNAVQFGGGKTVDSKTTRYALIRIANSPKVDAAIDTVIRERSGLSWNGRRITIYRVERDLFKTLWMEEPETIDHVVLPTQAIQNDRASEIPSIASASRELSASRMGRSDLQEDDTINVKSTARSSVLPKKSIPPADDDERPETDTEDLLGAFGATRDGQKSSRPKTPGEAVLGGSSTPSVRTTAKRGGSEAVSSRPSAKRKRRE